MSKFWVRFVGKNVLSRRSGCLDGSASALLFRRREWKIANIRRKNCIVRTRSLISWVEEWLYVLKFCLL